MSMLDIDRVSPQDARQRMSAGALLVCAYEDEERCRQASLPGAISVTELRRRGTAVAKDTPLIFYCA